jgi:HAD superfamily hydrolase (TIGR01509 family)
MNGIRGIIYDCDGVLFESRAANLAYYNAVLQQVGAPPVAADDHVKTHLCHTAASPEVFAALLDPARVEQALACAAALDYRQFIPFMTPEPGMVETLAALSTQMPLAVATNRGTSMPEILRHFGLSRYFQTVVTSRDVARPKPHPDMLELAARRLGLRESELLFVGDSELDSAAAMRAGIRFAAYKGDLPGELKIRSHNELAALFNQDARGGT